MYTWTKEDIESIFLQLDNQMLPFKKYRFSKIGNGLVLLGKGGTSHVYQAEMRKSEKEEFAIKVMGFSGTHVDSESFWESTEAQKLLGDSEKRIVKIYDAVELCIWIKGDHEIEKVEKIYRGEKNRPKGNCLYLQFIVMEKLTPVFVANKFEYRLTPYKLYNCESKEMLKLVTDIGTAVNCAHENKILHRDIKLENIFYSKDLRCYKLGDFGIAKMTDDGLASTVAFTKGYGAPEVVGAMEDKYDNTADIYSFGMTLYLLLNRIRFPGSKNYHPNIVYQYNENNVPLNPEYGSDEMCEIVLKMIRYKPDERYQTMEEVLNEFDKLNVGRHIKYQKNHKNLYYVFYAAFALSGAVAWKLTFAPDMDFDFSVSVYVLAVLCVLKGLFSLIKRRSFWVDAGILGIGIYIISSTGFASWKLILLSILIAVDGGDTVLFGGGMLLANTTYLWMHYNHLSVQQFYDYRWIAVLLLSLCWNYYLFYRINCARNNFFVKIRIKFNVYWYIVFIVLYIVFMIMSKCFEMDETLSMKVFDLVFGKRIYREQLLNIVLTVNLRLVGIYGIVFCTFMMLREYVLSYIENQKKNGCGNSHR